MTTAAETKAQVSHTPRPWSIASAGTQVWGPAPTETSHPCLIANLQQSPYSEAQVDANARLIAAAPELLAALDAIVSEIGHKHNGASWDAAYAALAKAKGE